MPLFDFCFNFTSSIFRNNEEGFIQRAFDADVNHFLVAGLDPEDSQLALELAQRYQKNMYTTAGVHPHMAKNWHDDTLKVLRELADNDRVKAIGEAGLDFNRNFSTHEQQEYAFRQQIELAISIQKPLFLHERDAHESFFSILSEYKNDIGPTVVHCFTGDEKALENYLTMDLYIGITGWICDERRGSHLHALVKTIPEDRLLIETDAPYLFPRTFKPRPKKMTNEPAYLAHIAEQIAYHRGDSLDKLSDYTMSNSLRFLGITDTPT
jgi:TatD DNase family protein|tara:strand:- start:147 stop:947 length:801 start_codon:yes stop_codon:yes gene_type:complete